VLLSLLPRKTTTTILPAPLHIFSISPVRYPPRSLAVLRSVAFQVAHPLLPLHPVVIPNLEGVRILAVLGKAKKAEGRERKRSWSITILLSSSERKSEIRSMRPPSNLRANVFESFLLKL